MADRSRACYLNGVNKEFRYKFCANSKVQQDTPEQGRCLHWLKIKTRMVV